MLLLTVLLLLYLLCVVAAADGATAADAVVAGYYACDVAGFAATGPQFLLQMRASKVVPNSGAFKMKYSTKQATKTEGKAGEREG